MAQKSKGGGQKHLYPVKSLPQQLQTALAINQINTSLENSEAAKAGAEVANNIKEGHQKKRSERAASLPQKPNRIDPRSSARLAIITTFETFHKASCFNLDFSRKLFAEHYNEGNIKALQTAHEEIPKISDRSLRRWASDLELQGTSALADNFGNRKNTGLVDTQEELKEFVVAMIVNYAHCNASHISQGMKARFKGRDDIQLPSSRSLRRWVTNYKNENAQVLTAISNPDEWKNQFMVAFGSYSEGIEHTNQLWEMDSTPADVMLKDGRHSIIGVIDVYTRRTKLLVSKTSTSTAIGTLIRQTLLDWGVPGKVKTDNGQDYTSQYMTWIFRHLNV
ncbi:DDE-type integrase/transposase/recombinase, partial [Candidatus Pacearchaeota archaeon]|nr:DDE-type integrase/transposase/recombinase [Candidatus Pacearchaeota archaeon]